MIGYQNNAKLKKKKIETLVSWQQKINQNRIFKKNNNNNKVLRKVTTIIISIYLVQPKDIAQHMI